MYPYTLDLYRVKNVIIGFICLFILFLGTNKVIGQQQFILHPRLFPIDTAFFYVEKVIDSRLDSTRMGYSRNTLEEKENLVLLGNTSSVIHQFLNETYKTKKQYIPVTIQLLFLKMEEAQTSSDEVTTRISIKLAFYTTDSIGIKRIGEVVHYKDEVFEDGSQEQINESHGRRLGEAIEGALKKFEKQYLVGQFEAQVVVEAELLKKNTQEQLDIPSQVPLGSWYNLITYKRIWGKHTTGWQLNYIGFSDRGQDFIIPVTFSYDQSRYNSEKSKYERVENFSIGFGAQGYIKIVPSLFANISLSVPVGVEIVKPYNRSNVHHFFIGLSSRQGIMYIPNTPLGLTFGAGLFQRIHNSKVEITDWGVELQIGIKF